MRRIEASTAFNRDFRREMKGRHRKVLDGLLETTIEALARDESLPPSRRDHPLTGDWVGYRDCHLKPDLLLIYRKPDAATLQLARLGSHAELFG